VGLDALPAVFRLDQAVAAGVPKDRVYALRDTGELDQVGRGVYAWRGSVDPALVLLAAATLRQPRATLCLTSALVHHGLSDEIPPLHDIALPRRTRPPAGFTYVSWHHFAPETFDVGRVQLSIGGVDTAIYSAERTIVDMFRLSHHEGEKAAVEALRRWLREVGHYPSIILTVAGHFPTTLPRLGRTLEILL
jgi:predicted transcriptional regulator of viral defense system